MDNLVDIKESLINFYYFFENKKNNTWDQIKIDILNNIKHIIKDSAFNNCSNVFRSNTSHDNLKKQFAECSSLIEDNEKRKNNQRYVGYNKNI